MDHLRCLQHNPTLMIWEQSYGADGRWDRALALAAAEKLLAKQQDRKKAVKDRNMKRQICLLVTILQTLMMIQKQILVSDAK